MGKAKDASERMLEECDDVFADIWNGLAFEGREVVKPEELESAGTVSQIRMADGLHEQERDIAKRWKRGEVILALLGMENESWSDPTMPLRVFSYDGGSYKEQVNRYQAARRRRKPAQPFYPSVTIVLNYGMERWHGPRTLKECFREMPEELEAFVPDYRIHVIDVAYLEPKQRERLTSDFRIVAEYLAQIRTTGIYASEREQYITHVDETLKLLSALSGDLRFAESINAPALKEVKEMGKVTVKSVIDYYINQGFEQGIERGIEQGIERGEEKARKKYEEILAEMQRRMEEMRRENQDLSARLAEAEALPGTEDGLKTRRTD